MKKEIGNWKFEPTSKSKKIKIAAKARRRKEAQNIEKQL